MQTAQNIDYKPLYEQSLLKVTKLEHELAQLKKMIFGARQERFTPSENNTAQLTLDVPCETVASCSLIDAKKITYTRNKVTIEATPFVNPGRAGLPKELRREGVIIEPEGDRTGYKKIREVITEILE